MRTPSIAPFSATAYHGKMAQEKGASHLYLLGLDFGSTTSSALIAQAKIEGESVQGHLRLGDTQIIYRSKIVFTPFINTPSLPNENKIDADCVRQMIQTWLKESGFTPEDFFAGGVMITGLAARSHNAHVLADLINQQIGEVLIATADDPCLESWLAFMGSCAALSRFHAHQLILNLDIGGGTTNPALGLNGQVSATGCYFIGARHFKFSAGTYKIIALTPEAQQLLQHLNIHKKEGDTLDKAECKRIIDQYIKALRAIALGDTQFFKTSAWKDVAQQVFNLDCINLDQKPAAKITFSGGVGELVYQFADAKTNTKTNTNVQNDLQNSVLSSTMLPSTTYFGDFGIDLACAIVDDPILNLDIHQFVPENKGRATVYGLTLHSTEVSGSSLYLPNPNILPLRNLPILASISESADNITLKQTILQFTHRAWHAHGGCLQLLPSTDATNKTDIRALGQNIAAAFTCAITEYAATGIHLINGLENSLPADLTQVLVILISENAGKTLGQYATNWGSLPINLIVIDEISVRRANFINIGKPYQSIVPIAFYGIQ